MKLRLFILIFNLSLITYTQTVRKYSNEFLNIGVNANALAMGKAVVSNVADVTAGYWNPAGLIKLNDSEISLMHAAYFANIAQYDYIGYAKPLDDNTALGFSLLRFGVDDILDTTELIDSEGNIDYNRIKLFSAADYAFLFSFAQKPLMKEFSWGINAKIIHRRIGKFATSIGFGFDAGFQYQTENWSYGVMMRDITTTYNAWSIDEEAFKKIQNALPNQNQELPETTELTIPKLQLGVGKKWEIKRDISLQSNIDLNVRFTNTNDLIHTSLVSIEPALGLEADYSEMIYVRAGINNIQHSVEYDNSKSLRFQPNIGVGFEYNGLHVDYALTNLASVGNALYSNIFSLKIDFEAFR